MDSLIYLDHAAATPVDSRVLDSMLPYFSADYFNPSATYLPARAVTAKLQDARATVAKWLGARPSEIVFTAGGTEANNLAIQGIMKQFPDGNVVVSAIEHDSVLAPASLYDCRQVAVTSDGSIDLEALKAAIDDKTILVSVMYANNEIGTIQPLAEVARIIKAKRASREAMSEARLPMSPELRKSAIDNRKSAALPLYFHTDACQATNYLDLHVARLGVDMMTINGGKIYGPKQSGALYVSSQVNLQPIILGGGQERNLRSGTENVAQAVGLATAFDMVQLARHDETKRQQDLQQRFITMLEQKIPTETINGSRKKRLPNNVHVTFPGQDNERLLLKLEQAGILAAAGSACSASNDEPSHVLRAIGLSDADAQSSVRFTMGRATTEAAIAITVTTLEKLLKS